MKFCCSRINRPGGTGRITNIHYADLDDLHSSPVVVGLDVKYTIYSGHDLHLDPELVNPHVELESRERRRAPVVPVPPVVETENVLPTSSHRESKSSKMISKRQAQATTKKGSATKAKLPLSDKICFPVRKKRTQSAAKSAKSPKCAHGTKLTAAEPCIPQEIVFSSTTVSNTPNSGCSKRATSLGSCSPLGEEGVENQLRTAASYDRMIQPLRPSVGTSNAHCCLLSDKKDDEGFCQNEDMDVDIVELRISPLTGHDKSIPKSCINAIPLASGCFSMEHEPSIVGAREIVDKGADKCNDMVDTLANKDATLRAHPTLRDIYDYEVKKASQFIGAVVQGRTNNEIGETSNDVTIRENRLNKFRSLLNDFLSDSDGMVESENLASNLRNFAISSSDDNFEYTEDDVQVFVSELCGQNKIMQTEGWIYNI